MTDIIFSLLRIVFTAAILYLNYFFILPTNFLIITWALFIISLVILAWDIYEWRQYEDNISKIESL